MWKIYDALIEGIDPGRVIERAGIGGYRAIVQSGSGCGLATILCSGDLPPVEYREAAEHVGRPLRDVAALAKSWDPEQAAYGMAAINAYYNDRRFFEAGGLPESCALSEGDLFTSLLPEITGKKVGMVGHFCGIPELYNPLCDFTVFEREPRDGDLPDAAAEYLMPDMELVIITGMTFTNKTLPRLLQLADKAKVVLTGPSVPMTPLLFDFGVSVLSGTTVTDTTGCFEAIGEGSQRGFYKYGRKIILKKV